MALPSPSFVGLHGGAPGAELLGLTAGVLERRARVGLDQVTGLDPLEAVALKQPCVLCLQQSAGNSAGPEVDVAPAFFGDRGLDGHVGDLDAPGGPEHPVDLGEDRALVGGEIDDAV